MTTDTEAASENTWIQHINTSLHIPQNKRQEMAIDLFAGCGGLALGFEALGFRTRGFETNLECVQTYRLNLAGECVCEYLTPQTQYPSAEIVIGGPPCQPFSVGGNQKGLEDSRDGFLAFIAAIEQVNPSIFLFENVRGLLYRNKWYFEQIKHRLEQLGYIVEAQLLNAKHYDVLQNRERVVVVGHRGGFKFPTPHTKTISAGAALGSMFEQVPDRAKWLTPSMDTYIAKYEKASCCKNPRDLHYDRPARTVTCRNLAGATGDMHRIRLPDGRRRRITVR